MSVVAGSRPEKTSICQGALQAHHAERGEEQPAGRSATQRAQCGEVQDGHAWKVRETFVVWDCVFIWLYYLSSPPGSSRLLVWQLCRPSRSFIPGWNRPLRWDLYQEQGGDWLVGWLHAPWASVASDTEYDGTFMDDMAVTGSICNKDEMREGCCQNLVMQLGGHSYECVVEQKDQRAFAGF